MFSNTKYNSIHYVENGGWHFTNIKSPEDIEKKFYDTGNFSIFPCNKIENIIENFKNNKPCYKFLPYFIERIRAIDINTYDDLNYAKLIYGLLKKKKDLN